MPTNSSEWLVLASNEGTVMIASMLPLSARNLPPAAGVTVDARAQRGSDFALMKERN